MSRGSTGLTVFVLAAWAMLTSYWMQPEELPPIPSFVAFCAFLFTVILSVWIIEELSNFVRVVRRRIGSRPARGNKDTGGEPTGT